jgi:hypothetical protein
LPAKIFRAKATEIGHKAALFGQLGSGAGDRENHMKRPIAGFAFAMLAIVGSVQDAVAACPAGKVTCAEFCRARPERTTCMSGHPNSCDQKPQGAQTCVGSGITQPSAQAGSCASRGMITCAQFCANNPGRTNCMTGHPNSCDRKPQGAKTCV